MSACITTSAPTSAATPDGLPEDKISLFAKRGTVCDVYDAVTSDRPYKKAWEPTVALHNMSK